MMLNMIMILIIAPLVFGFFFWVVCGGAWYSIRIEEEGRYFFKREWYKNVIYALLCGPLAWGMGLFVLILFYPIKVILKWLDS